MMKNGLYHQKTILTKIVLMPKDCCEVGENIFRKLIFFTWKFILSLQGDFLNVSIFLKFIFFHLRTFSVHSLPTFHPSKKSDIFSKKWFCWGLFRMDRRWNSNIFLTNENVLRVFSSGFQKVKIQIWAMILELKLGTGKRFSFKGTRLGILTFSVLHHFSKTNFNYFSHSQTR